MSENKKKGDDKMINKQITQKVVTVSNEQAMKAAAEQFKKFRGTFEKLAKN
ncbi:hypothetical protein [Paenibacillus hexagrammi]|uniref:Uncharacterized protein n=1 Tax=Paenibacillus hexagrammi TaxID=2908839 RepID=A0ABY3SR71_9BACL|nr:hypothetical protein [Paenibacillus sp. YPD9-1]UJF36563.1 hypothetical protein L0M14_30715 [Paenibacillus sp. YPD9-1]